MTHKEMYISLMKDADDFKNVTEVLFVNARMNSNISDEDFLEIKQVYFQLEREYKRKIGRLGNSNC